MKLHYWLSIVKDINITISSSRSYQKITQKYFVSFNRLIKKSNCIHNDSIFVYFIWSKQAKHQYKNCFRCSKPAVVVKAHSNYLKNVYKIHVGDIKTNRYLFLRLFLRGHVPFLPGPFLGVEAISL